MLHTTPCTYGLVACWKLVRAGTTMYLHFDSCSLAGLRLLFLLGRSLKFEIANVVSFDLRTRTVNAVLSTFVLRLH